MKKIYIVPELMVVELGIRRNLMLSGSYEGDVILTDGVEGDGTDIGVKENSSIWDNEW